MEIIKKYLKLILMFLNSVNLDGDGYAKSKYEGSIT